MNDRGPILDYRAKAADPAPRSAVEEGLGIVAALVCVVTGLIGLAVLGLGVFALVFAMFFEIAVDRPAGLWGGGVMTLLGLVLTYFSTKWFLAATR